MRLAWLASLLLCGCFDHGDGLAAGSGGTGGTGGTSGFSGVGGSFGGGPIGGGPGMGFFDGGVGGTLTPPCPFDDANCTFEMRSAVCEDLIECSTVGGRPFLSLDACVSEIDTRCVQCVRALGTDATDGGVTDDGGATESAACDETFEGSECDDFCDLLVEPAQFTVGCEMLAEAELAQAPVDAECLCAQCPFELEQCVFDDGCWLIAQCSARAGCRGTDCFLEPKCEPVIDSVGITSLSVSLFAQFGECTTNLCQTLND